MSRISIFLFLNIFHIQLYSQNYDDYFSKYSIHLRDSTSKSSIIDYDFNRFNGFFIGEAHNIKCLGDKDIIISNFILKHKKIDYMFFETAYRYALVYKEFNNVTNIANIDTIRDIKYYAMYDKVKEQLFKFILKYNEKVVDNRIKILPIDETELEEVNDAFIYNLFELKASLIPVEIRNDLVDFIKIFEIFERKSKKEKRYLNFMYDFEIHKELYKDYLKENYGYLRNTLEGLKISIMDKRIYGNYYYNSKDRENYMFKNISNTIDTSNSFISFNGQFHIPISEQNEYMGVSNWQSLAYKYNNYSRNKACSIYLLDINNDQYFDKNFKTEKEIILKYLLTGNLLIKLDGDNTPFIKLNDKYQYIFVW